MIKQKCLWTTWDIWDLIYMMSYKCRVFCRVDQFIQQIFNHLCSAENSRLLPCFWKLSTWSPFLRVWKHRLSFNVPTVFLGRSKKNMSFLLHRKILHPYNQRTEDLLFNRKSNFFPSKSVEKLVTANVQAPTSRRPKCAVPWKRRRNGSRQGEPTGFLQRSASKDYVIYIHVI